MEPSPGNLPRLYIIDCPRPRGHLQLWQGYIQNGEMARNSSRGPMTSPPTPSLRECQQLDLPCLSVASRHSLSVEDGGCFVWRPVFNIGTKGDREVDKTSDLHIGEP